MLNTFKLRSIYSEIQSKLFDLIPEKWDKIYLYASILEEQNLKETGEMFFYYYPRGFLKRNPINVYEVPTKFNLEEEQYMSLVANLYETIKKLRKEFARAKEKLWTNLTISIENAKFKVEYNYENLHITEYTNEDRHILWQYKYLHFSMDRFSKKDREMLENYIKKQQEEKVETKEYEEGIYKNHIYHKVEYDKQETMLESEKEEKETDFDEKEKNKNQILYF